MSTVVTTGEASTLFGTYPTCNAIYLPAYISHIVTIPPGPHILSEKLKSTPIAEGEDGVPAGFASGSGDNEFGIDGSMDPELELVRSRWSMHLKCICPFPDLSFLIL